MNWVKQLVRNTGLIVRRSSKTRPQKKNQLYSVCVLVLCCASLGLTKVLLHVLLNVSSYFISVARKKIHPLNKWCLLQVKQQCPLKTRALLQQQQVVTATGSDGSLLPLTYTERECLAINRATAESVNWVRSSRTTPFPATVSWRPPSFSSAKITQLHISWAEPLLAARNALTPPTSAVCSPQAVMLPVQPSSLAHWLTHSLIHSLDHFLFLRHTKG